jgi:hypothetical protein
MKWLKKQGWTLKRFPDKMAGYQMPLEGKSGSFQVQRAMKLFCIGLM